MARQTTAKNTTAANPPQSRRVAKSRSGQFQAPAKAPSAIECKLPGSVTLKSAPGVFRSLRDAFGVTQQEMRALAGISVRKISGLETGEKKPSLEDVRRFNELRRLREELAYITTPETIAEWLHLPNECFGGATPIQLIERGESDRLWRLIWRLQDGVPLD